MSCFDNILANNTQAQFLNKENTLFIRDVYATQWSEYINMYGTNVSYYTHGYSLSAHDFVYGEDPTSVFSDAKSIRILPEFQADTLMLAKFGIETNADVVIMISIKEYQDKFGIGAEPKSGDVMEFVDLAWEVSELPVYTDTLTNETTGFDARTLLCEYKDPKAVANIIMNAEDLYGYRYVRHPQLFEITEIRYQDYSQAGMHFLQGHYVWKIHAKRFDYSFERGISGENPTQQPYDNDLFGRLADNPTKLPYEQTVNTEGKKVWDYEEKGTDTSGYGYY